MLAAASGTLVHLDRISYDVYDLELRACVNRLVYTERRQNPLTIINHEALSITRDKRQEMGNKLFEAVKLTSWLSFRL